MRARCRYYFSNYVGNIGMLTYKTYIHSIAGYTIFNIDNSLALIAKLNLFWKWLWRAISVNTYEISIFLRVLFFQRQTKILVKTAFLCPLLVLNYLRWPHDRYLFLLSVYDSVTSQPNFSILISYKLFSWNGAVQYLFCIVRVVL